MPGLKVCAPDIIGYGVSTVGHMAYLDEEDIAAIQARVSETVPPLQARCVGKALRQAAPMNATPAAAAPSNKTVRRRTPGGDSGSSRQTSACEGGWASTTTAEPTSDEDDEEWEGEGEDEFESEEEQAAKRRGGRSRAPGMNRPRARAGVAKGKAKAKAQQAGASRGATRLAEPSPCPQNRRPLGGQASPLAEDEGRARSMGALHARGKGDYCKLVCSDSEKCVCAADAEDKCQGSRKCALALVQFKKGLALCERTPSERAMSGGEKVNDCQCVPNPVPSMLGCFARFAAMQLPVHSLLYNAGTTTRGSSSTSSTVASTAMVIPRCTSLASEVSSAAVSGLSLLAMLLLCNALMLPRRRCRSQSSWP